MKRLTDRELWVLNQVLSKELQSTKVQSLAQVLSSIRRHVIEELRARGVHPSALDDIEGEE